MRVVREKATRKDLFRLALRHQEESARYAFDALGLTDWLQKVKRNLHSFLLSAIERSGIVDINL